MSTISYGISLDGRKTNIEQAFRGRTYICPYCFERLQVIKSTAKADHFKHSPVQNRTPQQMLCPWYTGNGPDSDRYIEEADRIYIVNGGVPVHLIEQEKGKYELVALFPPLSQTNMDYLTTKNAKIEISKDGLKQVYSAWNLRKYRIRTVSEWIHVTCKNLDHTILEIRQKWEWGIKGLTFNDDFFMCGFGGGARVAQHSNIIVGKEYLFVNSNLRIHNISGIGFKKKGTLTLARYGYPYTFDVYSFVVTEMTDEAIQYIQTKGYQLLEKNDTLIPLWPPAVVEGKELIYPHNSGNAYLYHNREGQQDVYQWDGIYSRHILEKSDLICVPVDNKLLILSDYKYNELSKEIRYFLVQARKNYDFKRTFSPSIQWKRENGVCLEYEELLPEELGNQEFTCVSDYKTILLVCKDDYIEKSSLAKTGNITKGKKLVILNEPFKISIIDLVKEIEKENASGLQKKIINETVNKLYHCHSAYVRTEGRIDMWIVLAKELSSDLYKMLVYWKTIGRMPYKAENILLEMEKFLHETGN